MGSSRRHDKVPNPPLRGGADESFGLRRVLSRRDVLGLAFGAMVGWGWVILSGEMIDRAGTVGSVLAFVCGALMALLVGLTYAELTPALSRAGGELGFTFVALGPYASVACGWILLFAYVSVCAFEAVALPTVAGYLFPHLETGYLYSVAGWKVYLSWLAIALCGSIVIGVINFLGIRPASFLQWSASGIMILIGASFFVAGNLRGQWAHLEPLFTSSGGFFRVMIMTPFLFIGFDVIPQVIEEVRVPARALGKLIVLAILMAMGWYGLVQWTVGFVLSPAAHTASQLPTADAMATAYGSPWAGKVLVVAGLLGILTSWNAFFIGGTRLLFAMARGLMLPAVFGRLHPAYQTPAGAIALVTLLTALAPWLGRPALVWLVNAGGFATVLAYLMVTISFLRIRKRYPGLPRPYRLAAPRLLGSLAVAATAFFAALYLPGSPSALIWPYEWLLVLSWAALGGLFALGMQSAGAFKDPSAQGRRILGPYAEHLESPADGKTLTM